MTDAERWRHIAETKAWDRCGLCCAVRSVLGWHQSTNEQARRMLHAIRLFHQGEEHDGYGLFGLYYWPVMSPEGDCLRTYAALLLAAMADADGGNHREEPGA